MSEGILQQNLSEKGEFQRLYMMYLLFEEEPSRPDAEQVRRTLLRFFPEGVEQVSDVEGLCSFALTGHPVEYKDGKVPAQLLMADAVPFDGAKIDALQRTQQWECPQSAELLDKARFQLMFSDFVAAGLPYLERCEALTLWSEAMVELFPGCTGVWFPASGKLLTPEQVKNNPYEGSDRFLLGGMNIRFFSIQGTKDYLVDTLGLYAVGIPDVQYHFHQLNPDDVVNHAFSVASYQFGENAPIQNGETVEGFSSVHPEKGPNQEIQWPCQYELSLIQPKREVLDVQPGRFASGRRGGKERPAGQENTN